MSKKLFKGRVPEGVAEDLKALTSLTEADFSALCEIAVAVPRLYPPTDECVDAIAARFPAKERTAVYGALRILSFLFCKAVAEHLDLDALASEVKLIAVDEAQVPCTVDRVRTLSHVADKINQQTRVFYATRAVAPAFVGITSVYDLRAVYLKDEPPDTPGDRAADPIIAIEPTLIARIAAEEADEEKTFLVQMTMKNLDELQKFITDSRARLEELQLLSSRLSISTSTAKGPPV